MGAVSTADQRERRRHAHELRLASPQNPSFRGRAPPNCGELTRGMLSRSCGSAVATESTLAGRWLSLPLRRLALVSEMSSRRCSRRR